VVQPAEAVVAVRADSDIDLLSNDGERPRLETALLVLVAVGLQAIVWALMIYLFQIRHVWYGFYDISDTVLYYDYATRIAGGLQPYRGFPFEYPPLAVPLLTLPGHLTTLASYQQWFVGEMIAICLATAALTAVTAAQLWRGISRPLATAAAFAAAVLLTGAITANRYDVAVAFIIAVFALCAARRWWLAAAIALGLGFALKLTPALLLPLVFVLAVRPRRIVAAAIGFAVAAVLPFVPYLLHGTHGLFYVFSYNEQRPLQIESLLATPYMVAHALGLSHEAIVNNYGSQGLSASGAKQVAALSPWLIVAALAVVYAFIWRRREYLRATPSAVPLAALALVLAFVCTNKVLSPQFIIWTFPLVALVAVGRGRGQRVLGLLLLLAMLLTQVEFPAQYWNFVALHAGPIAIVATRNFVLLVAAVLAAVLVWRLPERPEPAQPGIYGQTARPGQPRQAAQPGPSGLSGQREQPAGPATHSRRRRPGRAGPLAAVGRAAPVAAVGRRRAIAYDAVGRTATSPGSLPADVAINPDQENT
jgi:hypothetical protein